MRFKIICSIIVAWLLVTTLPLSLVHASTASTKQLFSHSYANKGDLPNKLWQIVLADVTADGQFIVAAQYGAQDGYFLMKMNNEKITFTKTFGMGDIQFVKEKGLIIFLNEQTKMLEVYDESLKLLSKHDVKKQVPDTFGGNYINFYIHEQYISYHFDKYGYQEPVITYNDATPTGFIYDTAEKKIMTHAKFPTLPINEIIYSDDYSMHYVDALGRIKKQIRYYIPTLDEYEHVLLLQTNENSSNVAVQSKYPSSLKLMRTDLNGNMIEQHAFFGDLTGISYNFIEHNYNPYQAQNYRVFSKDRYVYSEYDIKTNTISKEQTLPKWLTFNSAHTLSEDFYYFLTNDGMWITPVESVEPIYKISGDSIIQRNEHFALVASHSSRNYQLFTIEDGKVHEQFYNNLFQFIGEEYLVALQPSYDEFSSNFTISVHALYPIAPVVAASNKMWTVTFNDTIDAKTVTKDSIYVVNEQNKKQDVTLRVNKNQVFIDAPKSSYTKGIYTLHIDRVASTSGIPLEQSITHAFDVR